MKISPSIGLRGFFTPLWGREYQISMSRRCGGRERKGTAGVGSDERGADVPAAQVELDDGDESEDGVVDFGDV